MRERTLIQGLAITTSILSGIGAILLTVTLLAPTTTSAQGTCPPVENTSFFTIVYGSVSVDGTGAPQGTVVEARSPRGDVVGCCAVQESGEYGTMYVYGEDSSAEPPVPGMRPGETVEFYLDGCEATSDPALTWSDDKAPHQVDLSAVSVQLEADFTGSPVSGTVPLTVAFINRSAGDYTGSLWDFGDGLTSTLENPEHTYDAADVYTVSLTVSAMGGSDTLTRTNYVTVCHWADLVCDCVVDVSDIQAIADAWRCRDGDGCYDTRHDVDGDNVVTVVDVMKVAAAWDWACP